MTRTDAGGRAVSPTAELEGELAGQYYADFSLHSLVTLWGLRRVLGGLAGVFERAFADGSAASDEVGQALREAAAAARRMTCPPEPKA